MFVLIPTSGKPLLSDVLSYVYMSLTPLWCMSALSLKYAILFCGCFLLGNPLCDHFCIVFPPAHRSRSSLSSFKFKNALAFRQCFLCGTPVWRRWRVGSFILPLVYKRMQFFLNPCHQNLKSIRAQQRNQSFLFPKFLFFFLLNCYWLTFT